MGVCFGGGDKNKDFYLSGEIKGKIKSEKHFYSSGFIGGDNDIKPPPSIKSGDDPINNTGNNIDDKQGSKIYVNIEGTTKEGDNDNQPNLSNSSKKETPIEANNEENNQKQNSNNSDNTLKNEKKKK